MRLFRLIDIEGTAVAEGFQSSDGRVVALSSSVQVGAVVYRSSEKMLEDWGRVRIEWDGELGQDRLTSMVSGVVT